MARLPKRTDYCARRQPGASGLMSMPLGFGAARIVSVWPCCLDGTEENGGVAGDLDLFESLHQHPVTLTAAGRPSGPMRSPEIGYS
jgi:hypothetical protein